MNASDTFSKYKPLIIVILLFLIVFLLRAQAVYLSPIPDDMKPYFQDENGLPYFSEMDSYYNYRMTQDFLNHGYPGDTIINGTQWDLHSYYPPGRSAEYPPLIIYVTAFVYILLNIFTQVPLTAVSYWLTAIIASLCVVPAYFFIKRLTNDYGGISAALVVATAGAYFSHSFVGFFDTDMFNVLLPLLVVWMFTVSINAHNIRKRILYGVLASLSMFLFSLAWQGWWYIFYLIIVTVILYLLVSNYIFRLKTIQSPSKYDKFQDWFINQPEISSLTLFILLSSFLIILAQGPSGFFNALTGSIGVTQLQAAIQSTAYPNVYVSVAELQVPSLETVIAQVGGLVVFIFGLVGVFLIFWRVKDKIKKAPEKEVQSRKTRRKQSKKAKKVKEEKKEEKNLPPLSLEKRREYLFYGLLLIIWLLITGYALTQGVRFVANFSVPIGLGAGIFIGLMVDYLRLYVKTSEYRVISLILLMGVLLVLPIYGAYSISSSVIPGTDDSMLNSMGWIKDNTANDTVIISWWDYGHLFTAAADRPVTFDGGSQNTPRAYWVGRALLTSDENQSAGILRMLSSSGDQGYLTLENYTGDTGKSVQILNEILGLDKEEARTIMVNNYGLTVEQADSVLVYTHPDNPRSYVLITSGDMLGKAGWWSYFGSWDFQKNQGTHYNYLPSAAVTLPNNDTTIILSQYGVIAQWNNTTNGSANITAALIDVSKIQNTSIDTNTFLDNVLTELRSGNGTLLLKPHKLIVIDNKTIIYNEIENPDGQFSIAIIKEGDSYQAIAFNRELDDSMFTKLYLLRGAGLEKFQLAYEQPGVMVWKPP